MTPVLVLAVGTPEIIWIVIGIGLLFGATRIPALMRGMGQGIREFKNAVKDDDAAPVATSGDPGEPRNAG